MKFSACGVEDLSRFDSAVDIIGLRIDVNGCLIHERAYDLQKNPTWRHLTELLKQFFGQPPDHLKYIDEEGDAISLGSDVEWEEALKVARNNGNNLHLCIWSLENNEMEAGGSDRKPSFSKVMGETRSEDLEFKDGHFLAVTSRDDRGAGGEENLPFSSAPLWFTTFMHKFKQELSVEITRRINRRFQKLVANGVVGLNVIDTEKQINMKDEALPSSVATKAVDYTSSSIDSSTTLHDDFGCSIILPSTFPKSTCVKSSSSQTSCFNAGTDNLISHNVICYNCHTDIIGIRYKCGNCLDFDLCANCESEADSHYPDHVFIKIRKPSKVIGAERKGKLCPLLMRVIYANDNLRSSGDGRKCWENHLESTLQQSLHVAASVELGASKAMQCTVQQSDTGIVPRIDKLRPVRATMDAEFLFDETVPDGTKFLPGVKFTKRWRIINSGSRPWNRDTTLKFLWGTKGFAPDLVEVAVPALQPTHSGSIGVEYSAPIRPGHYESHWNFVHKGHLFGHRIWCSIEVVNSNSGIDVSSKLNGSLEVQEPENGEKQKVVDGNIERVGSEVFSVQSLQSEATTPNNTPSVCSLPKSSDLIVNEAEHLSDGQGTFEDQDDLRDSESDSVVSLSSTDSESEFVVVPMPSCFDIPFVPSRDALVDSSSVPVTPTDVCGKFSSSGSSVVFIKLDGEESPKDVPINGGSSPVTEDLGIDSDHSYAIAGAVYLPTNDDREVGLSCEAHYVDVAVDGAFSNEIEVQTSGLFTESSNNSKEPAAFGHDDRKNNNGDLIGSHSSLLIEGDRCEYEEVIRNETSASRVCCDVPIVIVQQPPAENERKYTRERTVHTLSDEDSARDERVVNVLPEGLVSAAASIFNSARTALSALQWVPLSPEDDCSKVSTEPKCVDQQSNGTNTFQPSSSLPGAQSALSAVLWEMGFCNTIINASVIEKHCGDLEKVIDELLLQYDNDWYAHRH